MKSLITIFLLPIILLNLAGGIVAGIWLIAVGKWVLIVSALISTIVATWILGLLIAPTLIFARPLTWATERGKHTLIFILGALLSMWTYALMLFYSVGSFIFIFNNYEGGMKLPYLLLAYAVSTGPWAYMAKGESLYGEVGAGTNIPLFGACIASIAMIGVTTLYNMSSIAALAVACAIPLTLAWILQTIIIFFILKENSKILHNK